MAPKTHRDTNVHAGGEYSKHLRTGLRRCSKVTTKHITHRKTAKMAHVCPETDALKSVKIITTDASSSRSPHGVPKQRVGGLARALSRMRMSSPPSHKTKQSNGTRSESGNVKTAEIRRTSACGVILEPLP